MKKILGIVISILLMINIMFLCNSSVHADQTNNIIKNKIGIDIKGAVNNPGYYELDEDSTLYDAIKEANGLTLYADTSIVNLSKKLKNQDVLIIYTIDEVSEMKRGDTSIHIIEKECVCPKIDNAACIGSSSSSNIKININNATLKELMTLKGIGEGKAKKIIDYRGNKPFTKIEDIKNVKGIGDSIFDSIKENISV